MKDNAHGAFTPEMMKLPQATWIETFVEGVTDKSTGLPIFKELASFAYKVSGVMYSASACEHCWSIEGWIHSKRRNKIHQKLVEKLVRAHTNLVLRESLDGVEGECVRNIETPLDVPYTFSPSTLSCSPFSSCSREHSEGRVRARERRSPPSLLCTINCDFPRLPSTLMSYW